MKVLELGKFYPPERGGIESLLKLWSEGLVKAGVEVDCVVASRNRRALSETIGGVRVHRLASYGSCFSTSICPGYLTSTRRYTADIWHAHFPNPLADLTSLLGPSRVPLVVHWHSDIIRQRFALGLYGKVVQAVLRRAAKIVVATPLHLEHSPWLQAYRDKVEVIPFGLDLKRFQSVCVSKDKVHELRTRAGGRPILLNVGRLVGYKGQRYAIEAMKGLDAVLWLVGSGPMEPELRRIAKEMGVSSQVVFLGDASDDELPELMHACDIFVFPSITPNEAFGLVLVEAMACGKPLVACHLNSGVPFVCQEGSNGRLVPPRDVKALRQTLSDLLGDAAERLRLGENGMRRAYMEFTQEQMMVSTLNLFRRLIEAPQLS
jgi:rhamnosyl/mannosyltransferase